MTTAQTQLIQKYAKAFLHTCPEPLSAAQRVRTESLIALLTTDAQIRQLLALPVMSVADKKELVHRLLESYESSTLMIRLADLLMLRGRILLLGPILECVLELYALKEHRMHCIIATSHPVPESVLQLMQAFMKKKTGWTIDYTHVIDPSLIAGVRIFSNELLWEYSVDSQLRNSARALEQ